MTNYQFLQNYIELQQGIMFDRVEKIGFATICFSQDDPSSFWNNSLIKKTLSADQIEQVENRLTELGRKPAFYFENNHDTVLFAKELSAKNYHLMAEDSFLFFEGKPIGNFHFDQVKKVKTRSELEVFLKTFDACYQKNDPQNPYGELGEYLIAARAAWEKHHTTNRIEYFIVYQQGEPVAVSSLTTFNKIGYISNVGSLRSVRGQGFAKIATLYCIQQSQEHGNQFHCLATEEGTNPHQFYQALGFVPKFTSILMVRE